jgi:hypothetical protein
MALGSTQPLTKMSTRNLTGSYGRSAHKAGNLTAICGPTVQERWTPRRLRNVWATTAWYGDSFTFTLPVWWRGTNLSEVLIG